MSDNSKKTPVAKTLNEFATQKAFNAIQELGKGLPCKVVAIGAAAAQNAGQPNNYTLVTVQILVTNPPFTLPNITVAQAYPIYDYHPTQVGDFGILRPSDVYLGGVTGLGGGTADLSLRANLTNIVYSPVTNINWPAPVDPLKRQIQGPAGTIIQDMKGNSVITVQGGSETILITVTSQGNITITSNTVVTIVAPSVLVNP